MRDFETLSDVFTRPMHVNPQRVSSVGRVDVSGYTFTGCENAISVLYKFRLTLHITQSFEFRLSIINKAMLIVKNKILKDKFT